MDDSSHMRKMHAVIKGGSKYVNTVVFVLLVAFLLYVVWVNDAKYIINLVIENVTGLQSSFSNFIPKIFLTVILYIFFRLFSFIFIDLLMKRLHKWYKSQFNFDVMAKMLKLVLWVIFIIAVLIVFFENPGTIITSLGLVGFGITFALQKPILNFVGWLNISLKEIYRPGDRVKMGGIRGDVYEIGVMNTTLYGLLENFDIRSGKIVTVPNEIVLTGEIENYTKGTNYLVKDLSITITYESNREKAKKILFDIAVKVTHENKKRLKKEIAQEKETIEETLVDLGKQLVKSTPLVKRKIKQKIQKLEEEEKKLEAEEEELGEEFTPRVRIALKDSAVELICQFITPYDAITANKTRINELFLDAIEKHKDVEIAYPHMELVYNKTARLRK